MFCSFPSENTFYDLFLMFKKSSPFPNLTDSYSFFPSAFEIFPFFNYKLECTGGGLNLFKNICHILSIY